jgi:hypothetical protein
MGIYYLLSATMSDTMLTIMQTTVLPTESQV